MIFCFSGTGNSLHVAKSIANATDDYIVMITESEMKRNLEYHLNPSEKIGFVFPIYWWGIPILVEKFVSRLRFTGYNEHYVYSVCTYGLNSNNGLHDLRTILNSNGISMSASYEVKMVDNYIVGYEVKNKEQQHEILLHANEEILFIIKSINQLEHHYVKDGPYSLLKPFVHSFYKNKNHQKGFYVTDKCSGCHLCEQLCPCNAISMKEDKPVWTKNCSFCLKCINTCPQQAVQYKNTIGRTRYLYDEKLK